MKVFHLKNLNKKQSEDFSDVYTQILYQTRNLGQGNKGQEPTAIIVNDLEKFTHLHNTMFLFGVPTPHVNMTLTMIQFYVSKLFRANVFHFMTFLVEANFERGGRRSLLATMSESTSDNLCLIDFPFEDLPEFTVTKTEKKTSKFLFYSLLLLFSSATLTFDQQEMDKMLEDLHPTEGVAESNLRGRVDIYAYYQLVLIQIISDHHNTNKIQMTGPEWDEIEVRVLSEPKYSERSNFGVEHFPKLRSMIKTARYIYSRLWMEYNSQLSNLVTKSLIDVTYVFSYGYMATNDNFDRARYKSKPNEFVYAPFKREANTCNNGNRCSESKMFSYLQDAFDLRPGESVSTLLSGGIAYWFGPRERLNTTTNKTETFGTTDKFCLDITQMTQLGYVQFFENYKQINGRGAVKMLESFHKATKLEQTTFSPTEHMYVYDSQVNTAEGGPVEPSKTTHESVISNYLKVAIRYALPCPGCQKNYCSYVNNQRIATKEHIEFPACKFGNCDSRDVQK